ncbi:MAG TPA: hypothetical protein VJW75_00170 [Candidatus Eisenbacteria bacterium]|nr:hypothetical protein [Candidatus Eisenbacteria bacterium]
MERLGKQPGETNVVGLVDSIRSRAGEPLIVCQCADPTSPDKVAWMWVFHETASRRLKQLWAGLVNHSEADEIRHRLQAERGLWLGAIDCYHPPPSNWFRLVWTLPPAPCRIYTRRGMRCDVERSRVRVRGFWRTHELPLTGVERVEGWFNWSRSGIRLKFEQHPSADLELIRSGHPGAWLGYYDGIDLMVDTDWLDSLVPRVAEVLDVGWSIVDYTESPPAVRTSEITQPSPR